MKRIICMIAVVTLLACVLTGCFSKNNDPVEMARSLDAQDYGVFMFVDDELISDMVQEFRIGAKNIYCVSIAYPDGVDENESDYEKMGFFIYCNTVGKAEAVEEKLEEYIDDYELEDVILERSKNMVFLGGEDIYDDALNKNK